MKKKSDSDLLHIRVGAELKNQIEKLIEIGLFTNQTELAREAIRNLLLRYNDELKKIREKNEKNKQ